MKIIAAVVAFLTVACAILAGIGLLIARRLTAPVSGRIYDIEVREVDRDGKRPALTIDRTTSTSAAGIYNLWLENGGWVQLGQVVDQTQTTVTRVLLSEVGSPVHEGQLASWSGIYYQDPQAAGLDAEDVLVPTSNGPAPAWMIRSPHGMSDDWAIHIHGLGSPRSGTLRGVQVAAAAGLTSLVITYRNDGEGPLAGFGRNSLGFLESEDAGAAVRFAVKEGARRITLFGWSMGATIALQLAADHEFVGLIDSLVLESPVLSWGSTIGANLQRSGLPAWFGCFATPWLQNRILARFAGLQAGIPLSNLDWTEQAAELFTPTLIVHGHSDTSSPYTASRTLAGQRPDMVQLETFDADHTLTWNSDPEGWCVVVQDWLIRRLVSPRNNG